MICLCPNSDETILKRFSKVREMMRLEKLAWKKRNLGNYTNYQALSMP